MPSENRLVLRRRVRAIKYVQFGIAQLQIYTCKPLNVFERRYLNEKTFNLNAKNQ